MARIGSRARGRHDCEDAPIGRYSATSGFSVIGSSAFGFLKHICRPPPPALGHLRNRKQSFRFSPITSVDAKYIPDGETMMWPLHAADLISGPDVTLDHYS